MTYTNQTISFLLHDWTEKCPPLQCSIVISKQCVEIKVEGYGECEAEPGEGSVLILENQNGELRVFASLDINEDLTLLEFDQAREANRDG